MNAGKNLWKRLSHPSPDHVYPLIIMYQNVDVVIEQVDELLLFTPTCISISCSFGTVTFNGEQLTIRIMRQHELTISGEIHEVKFTRK